MNPPAPIMRRSSARQRPVDGLIGAAAVRMGLLALLVLLAAAPLSAAGPDAPVVKPETKQPIPLEQRPLLRHETSSAASPQKSTAPIGGIGLGRVLLSLAAVIGLILLMRWGGAKLFRGQGGPQSTGVMQVVARAAIAPRQQLMLVRVGRRLVVVGNSAGGMTALSQITDADEVAEILGQLKRRSDSSANPFASVFNRAETDYSMPPEAADARNDETPPADADGVAEPSPLAMQTELKGLLEKVRGMAKQFR